MFSAYYILQDSIGNVLFQSTDKTAVYDQLDSIDGDQYNLIEYIQDKIGSSVLRTTNLKRSYQDKLMPHGSNKIILSTQSVKSLLEHLLEQPSFQKDQEISVSS